MQAGNQTSEAKMTVKLNSGLQAAARMVDGKLCAFHFVNRKQALRKLFELGVGWRIENRGGPCFFIVQA
jgi:hypothetical protein